MKIYLLYENPYDEGDNVFGAFSTEEKANAAHEVFSPVNTHELYIREMELDKLEEAFPLAQSGYRWYSGYKSRHGFRDSVIYGNWDFSPCGLDSLFEDGANHVMVRPSRVWGFVKAKSEDEAVEVADKILSEKSAGYLERLE